MNRLVHFSGIFQIRFIEREPNLPRLGSPTSIGGEDVTSYKIEIVKVYEVKSEVANEFFKKDKRVA